MKRSCNKLFQFVAAACLPLDEVAFQQSFDTPVLAGSHTWFMEEGAVFGVRGTFKF